jgi:hypothetical protein
MHWEILFNKGVVVDINKDHPHVYTSLPANTATR